MMAAHSSPADARRLKARWVILGCLELTRAAALGGGSSGTADNPVLRDAASGAFLLTGESLAGALRSHLLDIEKGYFTPEGSATQKKQASDEDRLTAAQRLLGSFKGLRAEQGERDLGMQSPLIVYDASNANYDASNDESVAEIRDGIRRAPKSGVVEEDFKFDFEVVPRGTRFAVRFDLLIGDYPADPTPEILALSDERAQIAALLCALTGL
ncbi:MAG: hypothetical protein M3511_11375, partial [Deinococcota bacterium]|nr:hypothetical protein [Deinococcota bacterium]